MTVHAFTLAPHRAIVVRQLPGSGQWVAAFDGDPWRRPFVTEPGDVRGILKAVCERRFRAGLPIVIVKPRTRRKAGGGA